MPTNLTTADRRRGTETLRRLGLDHVLTDKDRSKGGSTAAKRMTKKQRVERARKGAKARWAA